MNIFFCIEVVIRMITKAGRREPDDFEALKGSFWGRITDIIGTHDIPWDLLFNWDQTGAKLVPIRLGLGRGGV